MPDDDKIVFDLVFKALENAGLDPVVLEDGSFVISTHYGSAQVDVLR